MLTLTAALTLPLAPYAFANAPEEQGSPMDIVMNIAFETQEEKARWRAVNDGVMGGKSSGGPSFNDGHLIFSGVINTDGGGFSSIRMQVPPGAMQADGLRLRVKGDGRAYELNLRTSARYWGRSIAYRAPIAPAPAGEWSEAYIAFEDLQPSVFGRSVRAKPFDPNDASILGIILADGQDGPFTLEVSGIETVQKAE